MLEDRYYLHLLNCFYDFGPRRLGRLVEYFPNFAAAYYANENELFDAGIEPRIIKQWLEKRLQINPELSLRLLTDNKINLLIYNDELYPQVLRKIPQPPPVLYYKGKLKKCEELCLAVVGTRKISPYGSSIMPRLLAPVITSGITIVSGLAYGVDALAHQTAIDQGGRTIAVLGSGLDEASLYPKQHRQLAQDILDSGGLLLSEYPPNRPALAQHFVARNRIISGISKAVLVVECGPESGALITADHARKQERKLFAVPGPIYSPMSQGTNDLLKQGAKPVTDGTEIVQELNVELTLVHQPRSFVALTPEEQTVLNLIGKEPLLADDIIAAAVSLEPHIVTAALTFLEIKGQVRNLGAQQYVRK